MTLSKFLTEVPPSLRWRLGELTTNTIYRRAFGHIGRGSTIVAPRQLRGVENIFIGDGVAIYAGGWLQCEAGGGPIRIGDSTYLGHDVHVHAIDAVTIGKDCVLADGVFITSTDHARDDRSHSTGTGAVLIGDRVFLGQRAIVLGGVTIGDGATVGAGAVVTRDVRAGTIVGGVPAQVLGARPMDRDPQS